ncbi:putative nuclease HARBI1, partial [Huso huso]
PRCTQWPTAPEFHTIKEGFHSICNFPNVVGVIDGTHIHIWMPCNDECHYVYWKGYLSLNVQIICNHKLIIRNVVAKWPGATQDAFIWSNCGVKAFEEDSSFQFGWLLGDSGYPRLPYLLTPVTTPTSRAEEEYNVDPCKTRQVIERCRGCLKMCFRALNKSGGALQYSPEKCVKIVIAALALHNIALQSTMVTEEAEDHPEHNDQPEETEQEPQNTAGCQVRNTLIEERYFLNGPRIFCVCIKLIPPSKKYFPYNSASKQHIVYVHICVCFIFVSWKRNNEQIYLFFNFFTKCLIRQINNNKKIHVVHESPSVTGVPSN